MQNLEKIETAISVKSWLFQITNNTIVDFYRSNKSRIIEPISDHIPSSDKDHNAYEGLSDCVMPFIKALPQEHAKLLEAVDIRGIPQKEYAEMVGINDSTLKSRLKKSRLHLKELFEKCCTFTIESHGGIS